MTCPISKQIAVNADEPNQTTEREILNELRGYDQTTIAGEEVYFWQLTDQLDIEDMKEAFQDSCIASNTNAIDKLYLEEIKRMVG